MRATFLIFIALILSACVATRHLAAAQVSKDEMISATLYSSESPRSVYLERLKNTIVRNWTYPEKSKQNKEEGVVVLVFTILQDGSLENSRVQRSSGFASLDKAAMGTIVSSVPFDSIPAQIGQTTMEVKFTFNYRLRLPVTLATDLPLNRMIQKLFDAELEAARRKEQIQDRRDEREYLRDEL